MLTICLFVVFLLLRANLYTYFYTMRYQKLYFLVRSQWKLIIFTLLFQFHLKDSEAFLHSTGSILFLSFCFYFCFLLFFVLFCFHLNLIRNQKYLSRFCAISFGFGKQWRSTVTAVDLFFCFVIDVSQKNPVIRRTISNRKQFVIWCWCVAAAAIGYIIKCFTEILLLCN